MAFSTLFLEASSSNDTMDGIKDMVSDLSQTIGVDLFEEDIDNVVFQTNEFLCNSDFIGSQGPFWWLLVVAVTYSPKHDFSRCKSATCKFLSRDTKSARDKNGTKPRKNKVKNTSPEISLVEYLCFVCKGTNLSLEKRGEIPISLIHNSFSYHCTPNVVIASDFDLKSMTCENRVLNFVLHSVGHFQKRELAIEPKICHPYCPILGFVNV